MISDDQTHVLVALTSAGLQVSTDGGDSWTLHAVGVEGEVLYAEIAGDDLYLGTARGIWKRPRSPRRNTGRGDSGVRKHRLLRVWNRRR